MARRLIGTETTGTDGSWSIPYTGTGAGLVQMDVETEIDGSIVSETYSIIDGVFRDGGVIGDTNSNWRKYSNTLSVRVESDGTLISNASGYNYYIPRINNADINLDIDEDWCIELDAMIPNAEDQCAIWVFSKAIDLDVLLGSANLYKHFKFTMIGKQLKCYVDDVYQPSLDKTITANNISIEVNSSSMKYKNFLVYPI